MRTALFLSCLALTGAAQGQTATFSVVLSPAGPLPNGAIVTGTVRVSWTDAPGIGYAGGAFRLRMNGLSVGDVLIPNNSNGGVNSESTAQRVGVPAGELPAGAGTVSTSWTSGRRPKRGYLADATDPTTLQSGGGFRFPHMSPTSPTDMHYSVEQQSGVTYLTARNNANVENRIEHAQIPRALQADPLFFEPQSAFDLFKFQFRIPLTGLPTITITPEVLSASIFTSDTGAQDMLTRDQITEVPATIIWPTPGTAAVFAFAALGLARRRRN